MTTVIEHGGELIALSKAVPEIVLEHCTHYLSSDGSTHELTAQDSWRPSKTGLADASALAMRTLAFAFAKLPVGIRAMKTRSTPSVKR